MLLQQGSTAAPIAVGWAGDLRLTLAPQIRHDLFDELFLQFNPLGTAAGYIFGGLLAPAAGWRAPFFVQVG